MKWRTEPRRPPKPGDTRTRRRFAWLPVPCDDGWTVWLERYEAVEVAANALSPFSGPVMEWHPVERHRLVVVW